MGGEVVDNGGNPPKKRTAGEVGEDGVKSTEEAPIMENDKTVAHYGFKMVLDGVKSNEAAPFMENDKTVAHYGIKDGDTVRLGYQPDDGSTENLLTGSPDDSFSGGLEFSPSSPSTPHCIKDGDTVHLGYQPDDGSNDNLPRGSLDDTFREFVFGDYEYSPSFVSTSQAGETGKNSGAQLNPRAGLGYTSTFGTDSDAAYGTLKKSSPRFHPTAGLGYSPYGSCSAPRNSEGVPFEVLYSSHLADLYEMGFLKCKTNLQALINTGGDLSAAVELLYKQKQDLHNVRDKQFAAGERQEKSVLYEDLYSDQLEHLVALGFCQFQSNLQALIATEGNLDAAYELLCTQDKEKL